MSEVADRSLEEMIGSYVVLFSSVELVMTLFSAKLVTKGKWDNLMFATARLAAEQKREILNRAIKKSLLPDEIDGLKPLLRRLQLAIERRNELMHGTYIGNPDSDAGLRLGRLANLQDTQDLPFLTRRSLAEDLDELTRTYQDLLEAFTQTQIGHGSSSGVP